MTSVLNRLNGWPKSGLKLEWNTTGISIRRDLTELGIDIGYEFKFVLYFILSNLTISLIFISFEEQSNNVYIEFNEATLNLMRQTIIYSGNNFKNPTDYNEITSNGVSKWSEKIFLTTTKNISHYYVPFPTGRELMNLTAWEAVGSMLLLTELEVHTRK